MPYICLARNDIPDGILQVLDLKPNSSLRVPAYEPPGQTRYLKRPTIDSVNFNANGTLERDVYGIAAYLVDHVEAGGLIQASAQLTCTAVVPGDVVLIKGVPFSAVPGGAIPALQQFDAIPPDAAVALSLFTAIIDPASIALMQLSDPHYVGAIPPIGNMVPLVALTGAGAPLLGGAGDLPVVPMSPSLTLNTPLNRLFRLLESWTAAGLTTTTNALLARVDGGLSLTLADINVAIGAGAVGSELTSVGGSTSTGTVADILAIMAGHEYYLPMQDPITGVMNQIMNPTTGVWDPSGFGGFTKAVLVNGDVMSYGEWKPTNIGGDIENREVGPYRATFNGGAFQKSLANGHLAVLAGVAGMTPVTLFPNHSPTPLFPWDFQDAVPYPQVTATRVVTVYDDTGAVLA